MPLLTIVEHYVTAAMERAVTEQLEDGTIVATVPGCPGVIAFGADAHECAAALYPRLIDWVKVNLAAGHALPVFAGIDLNTESGQILSTYHGEVASPLEGDFYEDGAALEAALDS